MSCESHAFTVVLHPVAEGETWDGLPNCSVTSTGTFTGSSLSSVVMVWKNSAGTTALTRTSATAGQITITDAANWQFDVEPITTWSLSAGNYSWTLTMTDSSGNIRKRVAGTQQTLQG
jgi:hypothetical protein